MTLAGQVIELQTAPPQFNPVEVIESILTPWPLTLLSVARRHRRRMLPPLAEAGMLTVVVTNPAELPVHALRPPMGEPKAVLIVEL